MSHPSKLIDRSKSGYQIRQTSTGYYQLYHGRVTKESVPILVSHDLERVRARRDSAISGAARASGATIPSSVRAARGYARVVLHPAAVAAVDSATLPGESRQDAARRLVIRGAEMSVKTDGS